MRALVNRVPIDKREEFGSSLTVMACIMGLMSLGMLLFFSVSSETIEDCTGPIWNRDCTKTVTEIPFSDRWPFLAIGLAGVGVIIACVWAIILLRTSSGHLRRYKAILTGVEMLSIQKISEITGYKPRQVRDEVQALIDSEMVDDFYIDYGRDLVVSKKYVPKTSHKTVVVCTGCGAQNDLIVGITKECAYCKQPLLL